MPNIFEPEFDQQREHPGFRAQRSRLGWHLGMQRLGASIWEISPAKPPIRTTTTSAKRSC